MLVSKLGFFTLTDSCVCMNGDCVELCDNNLLQRITQVFGQRAATLFVFPDDGMKIKYLMLDFSPYALPDGTTYKFLEVKMSPQEIHIVKKRFDEFFNF